MKFWQIFRIALSALKTNKTRSLLTMLGVIIGVASVITLLAIGSGLKNFISQQFQAMGSNLVYVIPGKLTQKGDSYSFSQEAAFFDFKFTAQDLTRIKREVEEAEAVVPMIRTAAQIKYRRQEKTVLVIGTTSQYSSVRNTKTVQGRFFKENEVASAKKVVVLGNEIAKELFLEDDPLHQEVTLDNFRFKVIGVAEKKGQGSGGIGFNIDELVYLPLQTAEKIFNQEKYNAIIIKAPSSQDIEKIKKETEKVLTTRLDEDEFTVADQRELLATIGNILAVFSIALGGIAAISLLVGGIGIMNIMLVSVTERTHEIGLRKAVGATPRNIMTQFLVEAVVLSVSGGVIGIFFSLIASFVLNKFFPTTVTLWSIIVAFFVSVVIGIIFGVGPAAKAAKLNPIDALRYE